MTRFPLPSRNDVVPSLIMSSISPVPKTPVPVSKVQNWLLLLVGVKGPAGPLNSSLQTSTQFVCAPADDASSRSAAVMSSKYRHTAKVENRLTRAGCSVGNCCASKRTAPDRFVIVMDDLPFKDLKFAFMHSWRSPWRSVYCKSDGRPPEHWLLNLDPAHQRVVLHRSELDHVLA